jgi:hypothetical protein
MRELPIDGYLGAMLRLDTPEIPAGLAGFRPAPGATNPEDVPDTIALTGLVPEPDARETVARIPAGSGRVFRALGRWDTDLSGAETADDAPFLMYFGMSVQPDALDDFHAWYRDEHIPGLLSVPGWLRIRRFERVAGDGADFLALHDLADLGVYEHPKFQAAATTPWLERVKTYTTVRERFVMIRDRSTNA